MTWSRRCRSRGGNPGRSKKGLYSIKDNFLQFWFKFVLPNLSYLETGRTDTVEHRIREQFIDNHVAFVYESVCRERLWDMVYSGALGFVPERVVRWWSGSDEIDAIALNVSQKRAVWGGVQVLEGSGWRKRAARL